MTVDEYKKQAGYLPGSNAPRCATCRHALKTRGLRCMEPTATKVIGGFAVKPDGWCPIYIKKQTV